MKMHNPEELRTPSEEAREGKGKIWTRILTLWAGRECRECCRECTLVVNVAGYISIAFAFAFGHSRCVVVRRLGGAVRGFPSPVTLAARPTFIDGRSLYLTLTHCWMISKTPGGQLTCSTIRGSVVTNTRYGVIVRKSDAHVDCVCAGTLVNVVAWKGTTLKCALSSSHNLRISAVRLSSIFCFWDMNARSLLLRVECYFVMCHLLSVPIIHIVSFS